MKRAPILALFVVLMGTLLLWTTGCRTAGRAMGSTGPAVVTHLTPVGAADLVSNNEVLVLDVRTPEEFADGHLAGAVNVDYKSEGFEAGLAALDSGSTVLVYCRSGNRSTRSLPALEKMGFERVFHLDGGFNAWKEAGQSIEK